MLKNLEFIFSLVDSHGSGFQQECIGFEEGRENKFIISLEGCYNSLGKSDWD